MPFGLLEAQLIAERGFHVLLQSCRVVTHYSLQNPSALVISQATREETAHD